jgi:hypothetical protein
MADITTDDLVAPASSNPFDTSINYDLHKNTHDVTTDIVSDLAGGAVATVTDIGASLWNSLPGTPEVDTADILKRIDPDALRVYEEHPDAIQTASFIGGMFIPMGLATKSMGLARSGIKGISWFSNASREADLAKVATLFENAAADTAEYRNLTRSIYAKTAVNQAIDAVAAEAAIVGMYNAHPYMEDYLKDPVQNFTLSALIGGGIGAGVGAIADRFILKSITGEALEGAISKVQDATRAITPDMTNAVKLQSYDKNITNLQDIIESRKALGKTDTDDLVYQLASSWQLNIKAEQAKLFEEMISPEIKALPTEEKDAFMRLIVTKPEMFGAENYRFLTEKEVTAQGLVKAPKFGLDSEPSFALNSGSKGPTLPKPTDAVYFQDLGLYGVKKDAIHYAGASVFGKTKEQFAKELPYNIGKIPNYDSNLELLSRSSAEVQKQYVATWERVAQMSPKEVSKVHISTTDGPFQNALLYRLITDPELAGVKIKISDNSPVVKHILKEHTEKLVQEGKISAQEAVNAGPDAGYIARVKSFTDGNNINAYTPTNSVARDLIRGWIGGSGVQDLRKAAVDYFAVKLGGYGKVGADASEAKKFAAIIDAPESQALRAKFRELADSDGNVYLYRGWKASAENIKGHSPIESYAVVPSKAAEFGHVKLYKVNVDDIVAGFKDVGASDNNAEILVRAPARPIEAHLDSKGLLAFKKAQAQSAGKIISTTTTTTTVTKELAEEGAKFVDAQELAKIFVANKQEAINSLLDSGMPMESIAIKTNTDLGIVKAWALSRQNLTSLEELIPPNVSPITALNKIKSYDQLDEALKSTNNPIVISGNAKKNPLYVENHVALDKHEMRVLNREFLYRVMLGSKNSAVQEMADMFYAPGGFGPALDIIAAKLGKVNSELAGNSFINSFDSFSRNMAEVGPAVSAIGKEGQNIANRFNKKIVEPLKTAMVEVQKDVGALVEYSTFHNINNSLKGWRQLDKDGYLVQKVEKVGEDGKPAIVLERVQYQGKDYQVVTPAARNLILAQQEMSPELRELANTVRKITGSPDVNDIGLWIPSFNPVDKFIAYVHDQVEGSTKLIWAKTDVALEESVKAYKKHLVETGQAERYKVVSNKSEQANWNLLNGRLDPILMERADVAMQKGGSASAVVAKPDISLLGEIVGGYEHYVTAQVRNLLDLNMSEVTEGLQRISTYGNRNFANQPLSEVKKAIFKPKDPAAIVRNTLLGSPNLGEYAGWQWLNKGFETSIALATNSLNALWNQTVRPLTKSIFGKSKELDISGIKKVDFEDFNKELESRGIQYPWKDLDKATAQKLGYFNIEDSPDTSKRIIYASNALAATMALRFAELAQPLVNAMSLPILTGLAIAQKMPESFMGVKKATVNAWPVQIMYEGVRSMNSPMFKALNDKWEKLGYFSPMVSEVTNLQRATRKFDRGLIPHIENALDHKIVEVMSKPADMAESMTRKVAMNVGGVLAKRLYPELDEAGITIFARDFMDKAIGNFHASQRPVMFQGTLGVALGLFQTYMLTLGQSIYRHLELKNYKALGVAALTQSGLFGTKSLPGFDAISHTIGEHFSDDHVDLSTGLYRAVPDRMADFMLYGMPSQVGPSFTTRGATDFRPPNFTAVQFLSQSMDFLNNMQKAVQQDNQNVGRAFAQALSLQSMSRPLARGAELATGYSLKQSGETVQIPEEVWSFQGVAARLLATRPIEEQKLRDADHLNHFYGALDRDNREKATNELRTAIRNGSLTDTNMAKLAEEYMRHGGSPAGWRSAVNNAIARTDTAGKETFVQKLKPENPLHYMIDNLER